MSNQTLDEGQKIYPEWVFTVNKDNNNIVYTNVPSGYGKPCSAPTTKHEMDFF